MLIFRFGLSFSAWAIPILWEILMSIDALIYGVAQQALRAFFDIADLSTNVQEYSKSVVFIMHRVMVLAGVFALFRLAIMLIGYLVDPNKSNDLSKNGPQIVKNIVLAFVLLMMSTRIFNTLGDFQRLVIQQEIIPKIVYGVDEGTSSKYNIKTSSLRFVNRVFLIFFQEKRVNCRGDDQLSSYCQAYNDVYNGRAEIFSIVGYASSDYFEYKPVISGIFGMILIYYFVIFAIELGTRIIKLVVLQVISPIPIIMSIDPSQKNRLTNFIKVYSGIYFQLFIRIITVYLAFVVAGLVVNSDFGIGTINTGMLLDGTTWFVDLLLYIGIFHAAKELPKLFEDALGLKMSGSLGGKSFGGVLKGIVGGGVGLVGGAVFGGISGGLGGALVGAGSGMVSAGLGVAASKNAAAGIKEAVNSVKGSYAMGARVAASDGLFRYGGGVFDNVTGRNARVDKKASTAADRLSAYENFESSVLNDYAESERVIGRDSAGNEIKQKIGKMEDDGDVLAARQARDAYLEKQRQEMITNNSSTVDLSQLPTYDKAIREAETRYKRRAFDWFDDQSIDSAGKLKYDPKKYSTLSASQKAHHEITRVDKKALTASDTTSLYDIFKNNKKAVKKESKELESEKQTDRYRRAQKASGK